MHIVFGYSNTSKSCDIGNVPNFVVDHDLAVFAAAPLLILAACAATVGTRLIIR